MNEQRKATRRRMRVKRQSASGRRRRCRLRFRGPFFAPPPDWQCPQCYHPAAVHFPTHAMSWNRLTFHFPVRATGREAERPATRPQREEYMYVTAKRGHGKTARGLDVLISSSAVRHNFGKFFYARCIRVADWTMGAVDKMGRNAAELSSGVPRNYPRPFQGPSITNSCRNAIPRSRMPKESKPALYFRCVVYIAELCDTGPRLNGEPSNHIVRGPLLYTLNTEWVNGSKWSKFGLSSSANTFDDKSFAAGGPRMWNNLLYSVYAYDRTLVTGNSNGSWKHFCLAVKTDHVLTTCLFGS